MVSKIHKSQKSQKLVRDIGKILRRDFLNFFPVLMASTNTRIKGINHEVTSKNTNIYKNFNLTSSAEMENVKTLPTIFNLVTFCTFMILFRNQCCTIDLAFRFLPHSPFNTFFKSRLHIYFVLLLMFRLYKKGQPVSPWCEGF